MQVLFRVLMLVFFITGTGLKRRFGGPKREPNN